MLKVLLRDPSVDQIGFEAYPWVGAVPHNQGSWDSSGDFGNWVASGSGVVAGVAGT